ncbi:hypothetical protein Ddye_031769 [Dipteronia dyeriana]|uniref:RNase H type-1 domain-containing protein n=1 Tax=Dipteronia dyeriana TaxID=168575 RepID=A0AAD9WNS9_9ROSI|nr:hypothetical protein Ddye_031769 [Dipteronia dyeriana]
MYEVSLNCWCKSFFKKLGDRVGEMVWIDKDTEDRSRFDRGRILILGPHDKSVSSLINVKVGKITTTVRLVESSDTISKIWVDEFLGLKPGSKLGDDCQNQERGSGMGCQVGGSHFIGDNLMEKETSSFESGLMNRQSMGFKAHKWECFKTRQHGIKGVGPKDIVQCKATGFDKESDKSNSSLGQYGLYEVISGNEKEPGETLLKKIDRFDNGIEICVDLREKEEEQVSLENRDTIEDDFQEQIDVNLGVGRSKSRNGVSRDIRTSTKQKMRRWILDVEVAKILETGITLGFDFNGKEVEVAEIVLAKEREDVERYQKDLPLKKLSEVKQESLKAKFKKEEVWVALSSCDGNKAPGPDGFNLNFIKANWEVIEGDFLKFIDEFHEDGRIVNKLNKTFIALIPKCGHPKDMKDFRPISLVGSLFKVLAKTLANGMKKGSVSAKILKEGFRVVVGRGDKARLWEDVLVEEFPLRVAFPRIFTLAVNKLGCIRDFWSSDGLASRWEVRLRRTLFDWELDQWRCFKVCLDNLSISDSVQDTLGWVHDSKGCFTVKSFWKCFEVGNAGVRSVFTRVWLGVCPPKIEIFVWQLLHGRTLVKVVLNRFGFRDAITAEFFAIARACELCLSKPELVGKQIMIVSDSQTAVSWITNDGCVNIEHAQTIVGIRNMLIIGDQISVVFCPRESNSFANMLAKNGSTLVKDILSWSDL